ncbi:hypothetical protein [Winslowiella iniecta]|uniref:Uncharacterized protein n=1 Tax=Winslowiella iniecta TaxID=1560201 RepID=A0A0L7TGR5_9GAMM|nr:hypothetical protein [Winslowiella iniecta]KOC91623.1 hypothetical protein NG42_05135 [Winslowiella iniecta]KOC94426.1 hypothetical protein NG43_04370 [Winslowiella iniecta]
MIDFSYLSDKTGVEPSFIIKDAELNIFEEAFIYLKEKTGIYIDPYSKTRVYPSHQGILIEYFNKSVEKRAKEFVEYLKISQKKDEVLIADGD